MPPVSQERRTKGDDQGNKEDKGRSPGDVHTLCICISIGTGSFGNLQPSPDGEQKKHDCRDANCGAPEPMA